MTRFSVHDSMESFFRSLLEAPKSQFFTNDYIVSATDSWRKFACGYFGQRMNAKDLYEAFQSPHEYEADQVSSNAGSILSDDFLMKRFEFVSRQASGMRCDGQRWLAGEDRCWFSVKRKPKKMRAIRVYAPWGGLGGITKKQMLVCGALTAAVVETLEAQGISVELYAACGVSNYFHNGDRLVSLVKMKGTEEYSDIGLLAWFCGDESVYRTGCWCDRIREAITSFDDSDSSKARYNPSWYGSSDILESDIPDEGEYNKENSIIIPRIYNIDSARQWFENKFNKGE